jgi:hypothetical protein
MQHYGYISLYFCFNLRLECFLQQNEKHLYSPFNKTIVVRHEELHKNGISNEKWVLGNL